MFKKLPIKQFGLCNFHLSINSIEDRNKRKIKNEKVQTKNQNFVLNGEMGKI